MVPSPIRFLVDSADRDSAERWLRTGVAEGITTNPTILRAAGAGARDIPEISRWARAAGAREVCFQTWGAGVEEQYANAMRILDDAPGATVKVPCTEEGAQVIARLTAQDVPVLMTAVYSAKQILIAAALGVRYLAPYFNRMIRAGRDPIVEIHRMTQVVPQDGSGPLVLAASLKSAQDLVRLCDIGVRAFTIAPAVFEDLFCDDLTTKAVAVFEDDMAAAGV